MASLSCAQKKKTVGEKLKRKVIGGAGSSAILYKLMNNDGGSHFGRHYDFIC